MSCTHPEKKALTPCPQCGEVFFPSQDIDYFTLFGLQPSYFIDQDQLQNKFYEISRNLHPDRFHTKSISSLLASTRWFAFVNKALMVLKSDAQRAEYLFSLAHFKPQNTKTALPPDLAEDYFTLQENMEDSALSPDQKRNELQSFGHRIDEKSQEADGRQLEAFKEWEAAGRPMDAKANLYFEKAAREINQKAYLKSMASDLEKKCQM